MSSGVLPARVSTTKHTLIRSILLQGKRLLVFAAANFRGRNPENVPWWKDVLEAFSEAVAGKGRDGSLESMS